MAAPWLKYQGGDDAPSPSPAPKPWERYQTVAPLVSDRVFDKDEDQQLYMQNQADIQKGAITPHVPSEGESPSDVGRPLAPEVLQQRARDAVISQRQQEAQQKAEADSRTPFKRAEDTRKQRDAYRALAAQSGRFEGMPVLLLRSLAPCAAEGLGHPPQFFSFGLGHQSGQHQQFTPLVSCQACQQAAIGLDGFQHIQADA